MRKRILSWLLLTVLCFFTLCPLRAAAVEAVDPQAEAGLTLYYQKDGYCFSELDICIYRVASVSPDGTFSLLAPFSDYPVNIYGITTQLQWDQVADTLHSRIVADGVAPSHQTKTDTSGSAVFQGLETGLYFVDAVRAENDTATYVFNRFMVYLPTPQPNGSQNYTVEANPKCTHYVPKRQYTVTKLWQDAGQGESRPKSVTVDIYKDGSLYETQILSSENNWSYTWKVSGEDTGVWTVAEQNVPEHYKVTVTQKGSVFYITNARQSQSVTPPTGDSFTPLPWVLALCLSGIGLLILAVFIRRRK